LEKAVIAKVGPQSFRTYINYMKVELPLFVYSLTVMKHGYSLYSSCEYYYDRLYGNDTVLTKGFCNSTYFQNARDLATQYRTFNIKYYQDRFN